MGGAVISWTDHRTFGNAPYPQIYAQRFSAAGTPRWSADGVKITSQQAVEVPPSGALDGAGGAIVAVGATQLRAQRVDATGTPQWTAWGVLLGGTPLFTQRAAIVPADSGSVIVVWTDTRGGTRDIYAQRINSSGIGVWGSGGAVLCTAANGQYTDAIAPDGSGGVIVAWSDYRSGANSDLYAQRVSGVGVAQWSANGVAISTAAGSQLFASALADGLGGAVLVWSDNRVSGNTDLYAQRVEHFGQLGNPEPAIASIRDIAGDEGGAVAGIAPPRAERALLATIENVQTVYWEYLATQPARGLPGYSYVAPTTTDSMPSANPKTSFIVMAEAIGGIPYWSSPADSGYSVDNLAPSTPTPFTADFGPMVTGAHYRVAFTSQDSSPAIEL